MMIKLNKAEINYIQYGTGKDILLLHGWGQNIDMMKPIGDRLCDNYRVTIIDFPGFGLSPEPDEVFSVGDYVLVVEELINKLKIKNPIIMGHSFGGRVAIKYASNHVIDKLVLFASPCFRIYKEDSLKIKTLKTLKKVPGLNVLGEHMKKYIGSRDYKAASPGMRETFVNVINEDLGEYAKQIEEPTLIIWGDHDEEVTYDEVKMIEDVMSDAALITLPGTHYAYLENLNQVINILESFI